MTAELHEFVYAQPSPPAQRSDVPAELAETPALSSEDRLLAWCDQWVARYPIAGDVVAYGSLTLTALLIALAVVSSSR